MTAIEFDESLYTASCDWIRDNCIAAGELDRAVGATPLEIEQLADAAVVPAATYSIYDTGIVSPVASLGKAGRLVDCFYGPAVTGWLRRSTVHLRHVGRASLSQSLQAWLDADFRSALLSSSADASRYGWSHLFEAGRLAPARFDQAAAALWEEWLGGGWAVCLRRFSGYDVVAKDIEIERIPALVRIASSDPQAELRLIDAMLRYDSIVQPFAPFERPISSRRRVIDEVAEACGLPWPARLIDRAIETAAA